MHGGEPGEPDGDEPEDDGGSRTDHPVTCARTAVGGREEEPAEEHGGRTEQQDGGAVVAHVRSEPIAGTPRPYEGPSAENRGGEPEAGP